MVSFPAMKAELETVLDLQPAWVASAPSDDMQLRGFFIREDLANLVRSRVDQLSARLLCDPEDVEIEGKDSGYYSRVPWVRFANRRLSPNPRTGWYAVYLFVEDGSEVSLSLNQGTQVWDGVGMRSRPEAQIRSRSDWARLALAEAIDQRSRLSAGIHIPGDGDKSRAYEAGSVVAYRYPRDDVPDDEALFDDLTDMAELLQLIYQAEARMPAPGDPSPEIVEAEGVVQEIAGRRPPRRTGFRASAKQRRAIELRAMELATAYFVGLGGSVQDLSSSRL